MKTNLYKNIIYLILKLSFYREFFYVKINIYIYIYRKNKKIQLFNNLNRIQYEGGLKMNKKNVEKIVRKYADLVYRVAYTILKNQSDAEDIFQDVFMKICTENIRFMSEEHEKAWLIKVTKNKCLDFLKRSCNNNKEELDENLVKEDTNSNQYVIDEVMKLPEKYRIIIYLFYFEGYKISEISQILEINDSTIKSQLVKARELLKENLKEEF